MADLSVIIVSYNTRELTLKAIETLLENSGEIRTQVVVWDNASHDGSADAIRERFPKVRVIAHEKNVGFAAANNLAVKHTKSDWVLLLNPDTETHPGAIENLLRFAKDNPQAGIVGGRTVFPDGSLNPSSCWARMTPWSLFCQAFGLTRVFPHSELFNPESMGAWPRDTVREVDIVVGCFFLLRRELWNELGGFNKKYFMYGEEADLCLRARALGYRPMITPDAQIMHLVGASETFRYEKTIRLMKAKATLIEDHWRSNDRRLGKVLLWLWIANRRYGSVLVAFLRNDYGVSGNWKKVWEARKDWMGGYS
ncbi:MAG: glycosyltransferase family 2 protein [Pseudomonadota bacterium]